MRWPRTLPALLLGFALACPPQANASQPARLAATELDTAATAAFRTVFDGARGRAGWGPFFLASPYTVAARANADSLAHGGNLDRFPPGTALVTGTSRNTSTTQVETAAADMARALLTGRTTSQETRRQWTTDAGFAVLETALGGDSVRLTGVVVLGVGPLVFGSDYYGCRVTRGFCWSLGGLNRHMTRLRNRVDVRVTASGSTRYRMKVVRLALARINAVPGLGIDLRLAGSTAATAVSPGVPVVVRWMRGGTFCNVATAAACMRARTYLGSYTGATVQVRALALRQDAAHLERWVGILSHEFGHVLGLGHFDRLYQGKTQMMNGGSYGPTRPRAGDRNGLVTMAPPGSISVTGSSAADANAGESLAVTATTSSSGFGGIRTVRLECTDPAQRWVVRATRVGTFDILPRTHSLAWQVPTDAPAYEATCRVVARSKAAVQVSATWQVTVHAAP